MYMNFNKNWYMFENCGQYDIPSLECGFLYLIVSGFSDGALCQELTCQYGRTKRHGFNPWVGKIPWKRAWKPTPVSLPEESHGERSLAGSSPWGCKELDMTEATHHTLKDQVHHLQRYDPMRTEDFLYSYLLDTSSFSF